MAIPPDPVEIRGGRKPTRCVCKPVVGGDPGWLQAHAELAALHVNKSSTYGTDEERFDNFVTVAEATGEVAERYIAERMLEKLTRALNQIRSGDSQAVKEWPDLASLALCAEALRRR